MIAEWARVTVSQNSLSDSYPPIHGPLSRYVKLRVALAPVMPGTFSPPPSVSDPYMHYGTCVTHVSWCMPRSLTTDFLWSRWWGKRSRNSRRMRNPQFYVTGKRQIVPRTPTSHALPSHPMLTLPLPLKQMYRKYACNTKAIQNTNEITGIQNLALMKPAWQSSGYAVHISEPAVDGIISPVWTDHSCIATAHDRWVYICHWPC